MTNQIIIDTLSKTFAFICMIETIAGIVLNPLILVIILKSKPLRTTSTFKILAVSAVNDILVGIPWNQEAFFSTMYNFHASYSNLFYCRWIASFVQQTTICIESWIVLTISVDRLFCMYIKKWKKVYFSGYRPYIFTIILSLLIAGLNFHLVFTSGHSVFNNGTEKVKCFITDPYYGYNWYDFAAKFTLYFGFIVPVGILIIVNILIIYKATQFSRVQRECEITNVANNKRKAQMTKMILFITFLYVLLSMPQKVFSGYIISLDIIDFSYGQTLINLVTALLTSYPAFYIFILYFSNKQFAREVKQIILSIKSRRASSINK